MQTVKAGVPLMRLVAMARRADVPMLLHGRHGVGKSEILASAAQTMGIAIEVLDLSLMEPTDLVGLPRIDADGRTRYAPPAFLPTEGAGLLVFEELNRARRDVQAPCLQLLAARRFNDYRLPPGWLPCAAVNDVADGYAVEELDAALLARFVQVRVVPDVASWTAWARSAAVHPSVLEFVARSPDIFDSDPVSNPRAWTWVSKVLRAWEAGEERHEEALLAGVAGLVGDTWATAFLAAYLGAERPLEARQVIDAYATHRAVLTGWISSGRLDLVAATLTGVQAHLQPQRRYDRVLRDPKQKAHVELFCSDLPADLREKARAWLAERQFNGITVRASPP